MTGARGARWTGTGWGGVIATQTARGQRPPVGASLSTGRSGHVAGSHWPVPRLWDDNSLGQEPWWNADRRAAPKGQSRARWCGGYGSAFVGVPLPWIYLANRVRRTERQRLHRSVLVRKPKFALHVAGDSRLGRGCVARTDRFVYLSPRRRGEELPRERWGLSARHHVLRDPIGDEIDAGLAVVDLAVLGAAFLGVEIFSVLFFVPSASCRKFASPGGMMRSFSPCSVQERTSNFFGDAREREFFHALDGAGEFEPRHAEHPRNLEMRGFPAPFFICSCVRNSQACMSQYIAPKATPPA